MQDYTCPICGTEESLTVTEKNKWVTIRCFSTNENGKKKCGLSMIYRERERDFILNWLFSLVPLAEPDNPDYIRWPSGYEGITKCPVCRCHARMGVSKNKFIFIRCAVCPSSFFIKQPYFENLYFGEVFAVPEKDEAFQKLIKSRERKTKKFLQGQTAYVE